MKRSLLFAALSLTACSRLAAQTIVVRTADTPAARPPTTPDHVELVLGMNPTRPYTVLGVVAVDSHFKDDPLALLRAGGARLGADAVMRVRLERIAGGVSTRGIAIAYVGEPH
jgi:hypothetical protein